jgi:hypothetical protein
MENIPTRLGDDMTETDENNVHDVFRLPDLTMGTLGNINAAVQTKMGVFYAVNPNVNWISAQLHRCSVLYTQQGTTQLNDKQAYEKPRLYFASPETKCQKSGVSIGGIKVNACTGDMLQEVIFSGEDQFWEYKYICKTAEETQMWNLFIEDITYFDATNVVLIVRHGPLNEYYDEAGLNIANPRGTNIPKKSRSIYYFVHTTTLMVRKWEAWPSPSNLILQQSNSLLCASDDVMPLLGSVLTSPLIMSVRFVSIIINQYTMNFFGIIESIVSGAGRCMGNHMKHYAYEFCHDTPFSMKPVFAEYIRLDVLLSTSVGRTIKFFKQRLQLPFEVDDTQANSFYDVYGIRSDILKLVLKGVKKGIGAAAGVATSLFLMTGYLGFFMYNDVFIVFIHKMLRLKFENGTSALAIIGDIMLLLSNTVYESIDTGTFRDTVMQPAEGTCQSLQSVFGKGPDEPIGTFVLHICMAASTTIHSVVHTISSVVTLSIVADCICSTYNEDKTVVTCRHKMPETMWLSLQIFLGNIPKNQQIDVCKTMIAQFQRVLLNMPGRPLYHMQTAMRAFIDIPPYIIALMEIPGYLKIYPKNIPKTLF